MRTTKLKLLLLAAIASASVVTVQANLVIGNIWENVAAPGPTQVNLDGSLANAYTLMGRGADVTFSVNTPISFTTYSPNGGNIGGFLASGGATITGGPDANPINKTVQNTLFYFAGTVSVVNGQTFTVTHDDGMELKIGGISVIYAVGPTPPVTQTLTYTGPTGTFSFEMAYAENSGEPGVLQIDLPLSAAVPEPSTYLAGALLLLPFGAHTIRRLRTPKQVS